MYTGKEICYRRRGWRRLAAALAAPALAVGLLWLLAPAVALANHDPDPNAPDCAEYNGKDRCECLYHVDSLIDQQLVDASPDPANPYPDRWMMRYLDRDRPVAWWRVERWQEACARLDLMAATRGITRILASSLTGLVGISFVWSVVKMTQESVSGGRVVETRNDMIRLLVGLIVFGSTWLIYESFTIGLFGTQSFTAGSFVGLTGQFGVARLGQ